MALTELSSARGTFLAAKAAAAEGRDPEEGGCQYEWWL